MLQAHRRAEMRQWERTAWQVSHGYAPHMKKGKKPPTPDKLLGRVTSSGHVKQERPGRAED